jgi:hypothetical protein
VLRAFKRRGLLEEDAAADMLGWQASGGFSVDASVRVEGDDRAGLERLVRYCARGRSRWAGRRPSSLPTHGSSTGSPNPTYTAAPRSCSPPSSCWSGSRASSHPRACTATDTTGSSRRTPACWPPSWPSAGPAPPPLHRTQPRTPQRRPRPLPLRTGPALRAPPASAGLSCSRASTRCSRSSARPAAVR